jgi:hypothetical protein
MGLATIVDLGALWKTIAAAFVSAVGVTLVFSIGILGAARFADVSRDGRPAAAAMFAALTMISLIAVAAAVTIGIIVMLSK